MAGKRGYAEFRWDGKTGISSTEYPAPDQPATPTYRVIESGSTAGLAALVSSAMVEGWKPVGGLLRWGDCYYQSMTRPAGQSPVPKAGPEFRPEEDGTIGPKPAGKVEVPKGAWLPPLGTTLNSEWFKTPESAGAVPPRKAVDPAEERRLIAWLSGLAKSQPGWVADWVYKTAVGAKPHATVHLRTDDVTNILFTGYGYALKGTAELLFPWAELSIQPRRPVNPS